MRVVAIEVDSRLVEHLQRKFAGDQRLTIVHQNVLDVDLGQWGPAPIAGNLPYYITSPILEKATRLQAPRAVFLIQKEVAERLVAQPGGRDYGFLTVQTGLWAYARLLFEVKPSAFHPPPKVDSAVVMLQPRPLPEGMDDPDAFLRFVGRCFRHKRKTIRNNLDIEGVETWPEASLRAEQLSLEQFVMMHRRLVGVE